MCAQPRAEPLPNAKPIFMSDAIFLPMGDDVEKPHLFPAEALKRGQYLSISAF
jgi:hypothetical protein